MKRLKWVLALLMSASGLLTLAACDSYSDGGCLCVPAGGFCTGHLDCEGALLCNSGVCGGGVGGGGGGGCLGANSGCSSNGQCCSAICTSQTDRCADSCYAHSQCVSGCCAPLTSGGSACAPTSYCY
ncbi:MAG TPA: hypothetical protein PK095_15060 [Myxococcota bacterium]|nr:hypothetical protein [Myxococcota bacterium]